jgi:hypothetical protein
MRQEKTQRQIRTRGIGIAAALAAAVALFAAGPAQARNEFQNGFEDQLGRIAAVGAVNFGLSVLSGGYYPAYPAVVPVPVAPVVVHQPVYYAPTYYRPVYPAYYAPRPVVVVKHKYKNHGHGKRAYYGRGW